MRYWYGIILLPLLAGVFIGWNQGQQSDAASIAGLDFQIGCSGFRSEGGRIVTNRDNTGQGREAFIITATDGNGNVIYGPVTETFLTGGQLSIPSGTFYNWGAAPQANPIMVTMTSIAGNQQGEQLFFQQTGLCSGLPSGGSGLGLDLLPVDGETSPSVPLNTVPPIASNVNNVEQVYNLSGHLVVNTARLNMRSGAGVQYTRVGVVTGGTELIVLGANNARSWFYVQVGTMRGWVSGDYVVVRGNISEVSLLPGGGEIQPPRFILYLPQPLLAGPGTNTSVLCSLLANQEFNIIGRDPEANWYQVQGSCSDGQVIQGWIRAEWGAVRNPARQRIPVTL